MAGNLIIKNGQDQEFRITHNDNVGAVTLESDKIAVKNDTKKRRNYLINGNFQFWDYATSQTTSGYGSDNRWSNNNLGPTKTHSRMSSGDTERVLFESPYYSRTVVSSMLGVNNYVIKFQKIEDITKLAGKTVTLSFWAKADSTKNITVEFGQVFGTGGTISPESNAIESTTLNITTAWKKYSATVVIPSIVGKTLGTDGVHTTSTFISFWFDAGSDYNSRTNNLGQQSGTFDIAEVKLEDGSVATDGWAAYDGEWGSEAVARQRYLRDIGKGFYGVSNSTSTILMSGTFSFDMRITPTITSLGNGVDALVAAGQTPTSINTIINNGATRTSYWIYGGGAFTPNLAHTCINDIVRLSAELG